jgi:hypothetical protein
MSGSMNTKPDTRSSDPDWIAELIKLLRRDREGGPDRTENVLFQNRTRTKISKKVSPDQKTEERT